MKGKDLKDKQTRCRPARRLVQLHLVVTHLVLPPHLDVAQGRELLAPEKLLPSGEVQLAYHVRPDFSTRVWKVSPDQSSKYVHIHKSTTSDCS